MKHSESTGFLPHPLQQVKAFHLSFLLLLCLCPAKEGEVQRHVLDHSPLCLKD